MSFNDIPILSSGCHFNLWTRTLYAMLVEGIMRNISVNNFKKNGPVVSGGDDIYI